MSTVHIKASVVQVPSRHDLVDAVQQRDHSSRAIGKPRCLHCDLKTAKALGNGLHAESVVFDCQILMSAMHALFGTWRISETVLWKEVAPLTDLTAYDLPEAA
jgi:hypothetical protein